MAFAYLSIVKEAVGENGGLFGPRQLYLFIQQCVSDDLRYCLDRGYGSPCNIVGVDVKAVCVLRFLQVLIIRQNALEAIGIYLLQTIAEGGDSNQGGLYGGFVNRDLHVYSSCFILGAAPF